MKQKAIQIIKKLQDNDFQAVYAGGVVRDMIMGIEPHDYDIATSATPDEVESLFDRTISVGKSFGVIRVLIDNKEFEVATFRTDGNYSDNRRPDSVKFCSMEEDAKRRDFTINGLFYDPIKDKYYDFVGGIKDIKNQILRFIGNSIDRIREDHLRLIRAIRFYSRFDFSIEHDSFISIIKNPKLIDTVSKERVAEELNKMFLQCSNSYFLVELYYTGLLREVLPDITRMIICEQSEQYHPEGTVWVHTLLTIDNLPKNSSLELYWAALLHDIGKPEIQRWDKEKDRYTFNRHEKHSAVISEKILTDLKFSNNFIERVTSMVSNHMRFMAAKKMRKSCLKRFLAMDNFNEHLELHKADCLASHGSLENYDFCIEKLEEFGKLTFEPKLELPPPLINGYDLIDMGFISSPMFKIILEDIQTKQLDDEILNKGDAILYIKKEYEPGIILCKENI